MGAQLASRGEGGVVFAYAGFCAVLGASSLRAAVFDVLADALVVALVALSVACGVLFFAVASAAAVGVASDGIVPASAAACFSVVFSWRNVPSGGVLF